MSKPVTVGPFFDGIRSKDKQPGKADASAAGLSARRSVTAANGKAAGPQPRRLVYAARWALAVLALPRSCYLMDG